MATSPGGRRKGGQFWRADWFVGVWLVLAVLLLYGFTDFFGKLDRRYYDFSGTSTSTSTSRQPSNRTAIIAIDDQSIANIGRLPWPRDVQAQLANPALGPTAAPELLGKVIADTEETDSVKVADFGMARITDSSKTKTGLVLGTPSFMSPEQIAGKKFDGWSDRYSSGIMLFQMLAGAPVHRTNDTHTTLQAKATC